MPPVHPLAFPRARRGASTGQEIDARDVKIVTSQAAGRAEFDAVDSTYAWIRLFVALVLGTIGSVGMWSYVVALPPVQADFGILRNAASLPYTMAMIGFAFGGVAMGRLADRHGIVFPAIARNPAARHRLCGGRLCAEHLAARCRARADRLRHLGNIRADRLRHVALVQEAARRRDRDRVVRQLRGGRGVAADRAALHHQRRLARDAYRRRHLLRRHHDPADPDDAAALAGRDRGARRGAGAARYARTEAEHPAGAAGDRGRRLLRRDGDAAGAHRRLLRRPRLRRRARRRDALADARARPDRARALRHASRTASAGLRRC